MRIGAAISRSFGFEHRHEALEPRPRSADGHVGDLADVKTSHLHGKCLWLQAITATGFAGPVRLVTGKLLAHPLGIGLAPAALDIADHSLEGLARFVGPHPIVIGDHYLLIAGAEKNALASLLRQLLPRRGHRNAVMLGEGLEGLHVVGRGRP